MKIGILTFHDGINHGAYLQAYALQRYFVSKGLKNTIINYKNNTFTRNEYLAFIKRKNPVRIVENIYKIIKFKKAQRKLNMTERIYSYKDLEKNRFDTVVIGSDCVWNYTSPLITYDPVYFSKGLNANKIISYAASFGQDEADGGYPPEIKELLRRLNAISVRDNNSRNNVKLISGRESEIVIDPTFLFDFNDEVKPCPFRNFILVYSVKKLTRMEQKAIRQMADKYGKKIVGIGYYMQGCDVNRVALDPFEWLGYFQQADFIVTSTFHGTIFSIINRKPFCTITTPSIKCKTEDFLNRMELGHRIARNDADLSIILESQIDYDKVEKKLNVEIEKSKKFLEEQLT